MNTELESATTEEAAPEPSALSPWLIGAISLVLLSVLSLAVLQYAMPARYICLWGINQIGLHLFRQTLHLNDFPRLSTPAFRIAFQVCLLTAYIAYVAMLILARRLTSLPIKKWIAIVAAFGVVIAVLFPTSLSGDTYSYVGYARMTAVYHLNPYFNPPHVLEQRSDAVVDYLPRMESKHPHPPLEWDIPTVYGPIWTLLTGALIGVESSSSIWMQVVTMKLLEVLALCIAAYAGWRISRNLSPKHAPVVFLSIGLNPLLLVEGIGSGHNDLLMMSLILLGGSLMLDRKPCWGAFALGLSVGVKLITLAVVPWILWENRRQFNKLGVIAGVAAGLLLPTVLGFAPFWHGPQTLSAITLRSSGLALANADPHTAISAAINQSKHTKSIVSMIRDKGPVLGIYAALTVLIVALSVSGFWLAAWTVLALCLVHYVMGILFPWYVVWLWPTAASRVNHLHVNLSAFAWGSALIFSWFYTLVSGHVAAVLLFNSECLFATAIFTLNSIFIKKIKKYFARNS